MELEDLKIGDPVILNSGSVPMTVVEVDGKTITVTYYNKVDGKLYTHNITANAITRYGA